MTWKVSGAKWLTLISAPICNVFGTLVIVGLVGTGGWTVFEMFLNRAIEYQGDVAPAVEIQRQLV